MDNLPTVSDPFIVFGKNLSADVSSYQGSVISDNTSNGSFEYEKVLKKPRNKEKNEKLCDWRRQTN